jgi:hypothetical protein
MQAKGGYNNMSKSLVKLVSYPLVIAMLVIGVAPRVEAGFSPSDAIALSQADRVDDLATIQKILESKKIGKRLENLGFSQSEIQLRIPVKTATCSGNNLTTFQSSNSLVDSNTKVAGLCQCFA